MASSSSIEISQERFQNTGIKAKGNFSPQQLEDVLKREEAKQTKSAVFVYIEEEQLPICLPLLIKRGYNFHGYVDKVYSYYLWRNKTVSDKVPPFASSISGSSAIILNPQEDSILLI